MKIDRMKQSIFIILIALIGCAAPQPCPVCPDCPGDSTVVVIPVDTVSLALKQRIGTNTFPWVPLSKLSPFGTVRVYFAAHWGWRPGGLAIQPMHQAETQETHGMDEYLERCKSANITPLMCIHQTPEWYSPTGRQDGGSDIAPNKPGTIRTDPKSYSDYAAFLWQVTARYGRKAWPESALRVDRTPRWSGDILNDKKSGLGLLKYIECWNETDKWWKIGTPEYFTPPEAAALMSACFDAIKEADPSMQVVMPGLTDFNMDYLRQMDAWFTVNRPKKDWPCDIMNFHHYSHLGNKKGQFPPYWFDSGACAPDKDQNFSTVAEVVAFANALGKKVWITEFGCDTRPPSWMHVQGGEQAQGALLTATYKAYFDAGIERCYMFNSVDEYGIGLYQSSGILSSEANGFKPKPAWLEIDKLTKTKN